MSVCLHVLFDRSRLPELGQWQQRLDGAGADLRLQALDPDEHTGFWPATFGDDGEAGFEFDRTRILVLEAAAGLSVTVRRSIERSSPQAPGGSAWRQMRRRRLMPQGDR